MHWMKYFARDALICEQLENIEQEVITHIIQKVANQCQGYCRLAKVILHTFYYS